MTITSSTEGIWKSMAHTPQPDTEYTERQLFTCYMREMLRAKQLRQTDLFARADIPLRYGYKLISGERRTKRQDVIIRLCVAAAFSLEETQKALRLYHLPLLYEEFSRDALIMHAITEGVHHIDALNELLMQNKKAPLYACRPTA